MSSPKIIAIFTKNGFETISISSEGNNKATAFEVCKAIEPKLFELGLLIKSKFEDKNSNTDSLLDA